MFLGALILRHQYSLLKKLSVLAITLGLVLCTWEDYKLTKSSVGGYKWTNNTSGHNATISPSSSSTSSFSTSTNLQENSFTALLDSLSLESFWQLVGIAYLAASLFISAGIGIYQERLRNRFGKHPSETLFYVVWLILRIFPSLF